MPEFSIVKVPHFIAVSPFNLTDPAGHPLYVVEHLIDNDGMIFAMICEGALPPPRCASCGDADNATTRGQFSGYVFAEPWSKTDNPENAPKFHPVSSIYGPGEREQLIRKLTGENHNGLND